MYIILILFILILNKTIFKKIFKCPMFNNIINETNDKGFADGECFRCKKSFPKQDIKYSIQKSSIFENIKMNLIAIYFLIYECLVINLSINKSYIEYIIFNEYFHAGNVSKTNIGKLFGILRKAIKIKMNAYWKKIT